MRKFLFTIAGAFVLFLGSGNILPSEAQAQPWGAGHSRSYYYGPPRHRVHPVRCWTETSRYWNGRYWVVRKERVCRR